MPDTLQTRLDQLVISSFVGRVELRERFKRVTEGSPDESLIQYIFGPGGVGKTTLLKHFHATAREMGIRCVYIDGKIVDSTPTSFKHALATELAEDESAVMNALSELDEPFILLLDTFEHVSGLEPWMLRNFLPLLSTQSSVVIAGRNPPSPVWDTIPGWRSMIDKVRLRNLDPDDSRDFLAQSGVPVEQHDAIINFTQGHPLALSLVADVSRQRPDSTFQPSKDPDVVKALLNRFVEKVETPLHRMAIEASALVRFTSEPLLAAMLDIPNASEVFGWLRDLSFMESGRAGLYPHDLARGVVTSDLKWRNRVLYEQLHNRSRAYYKEHLGDSGADRQRQILSDYIYLHRDNPVIQPFFTELSRQNNDNVIILDDFNLEKDRGVILDVVEKFEGAESRDYVNNWLRTQPENVLIFRDESDDVKGFLVSVAIVAGNEETYKTDPATNCAVDFLNSTDALRPGERATLFRSWMSVDDYQELSPVQTQIFLSMVRHYLTTPDLAYSFLPFADVGPWEIICSYADLHRIPDADFTVSQTTYGVFGHDWRKRPATDWLDLLADRELGAGRIETPQQIESDIEVLSRERFAWAVRQALKSYSRPWKLGDNPLLYAGIVSSELDDTDAGTEERTDALLAVIEKNVQALDETRNGKKYCRALTRMYIKPAGSQEKAAEVLDLPYSTFRRHLKKGVDELIEMLWYDEIG